jgi:LysR family carnitine catabolism transcriptional activator
MFSIHNLRVFIAVAESGEIRAAAERLSRTPSAISMTLKQIESEIGAPLFEGERKNRLTSLGQMLFYEGRDLLEHCSRTHANVMMLASRERTTTSIACTPSFAVTFLPILIKELSLQKPVVHLHARDIDSRSVREAVATGTVDVGIGSYRESVQGLTFTPLYSDRLSVLCHKDSKLAKSRRPITWKDLTGYPFLAHDGYGMIKDAAFLALVERAQAHLPNVMSLFALVKADIGITILPRLFEAQADKSIQFLPLKDPNAYQIVGVIARNGYRAPPATNNFLTLLRTMIRKDHSKLGLSIKVDS